MSELPASWQSSTLSTVCSKGQYGWTTRASAEGSIKFLRTTDITKGPITWNSVPYCSDAPSDLSKYLLHAGDILISRAGSVGFSALIQDIPAPAVFASYLIRFVPLDCAEGRYVAYFLRSDDYWHQIGAVSAGIALANVNAAKLADVQLPVAPLPEQRRIADKLDAVVARVDACRERLDRVPAILKRFREAVLEAAVSGRLTEEWRESRGRSLDRWSKTTVGTFLIRIEAGVNLQCEERPPGLGEKGLIKISAVTWGKFNEEESKTLPKSREVPESTRITRGDFLMSRANTLELVGACVIVDKVTLPIYLSDKVWRLLVDEQIKPWLLISLRSRAGRRQIEELASGNQLSMRNLSQANLKTIELAMPDPDERSEIARRVDELFALADQLEAKYHAAAERVEKLIPAVLAKAFRGELVAQDPEDEPASVLLERVRKERETDGRFGLAGRGPGRRAGSGGRGRATVKAGGAGKARGRRGRAS